MKSTEGGANRLAGEKSPYLLQHAANPVDWYPWGEEAFRRARELDRPVFLSIGYATCHWCHVMERESFEDREIARLMNGTFVSVKVDREERPDLDHYFMSVCQGLTGSGGWPLTVLMTPDGKPFFAGTYFPRESRFGRVGMVDLVPRLGELWREKREEVLATSESIVASLRRSREGGTAAAVDAESVLAKTKDQLAAHFDDKHGGFGKAPKFPHPDFLRLLLRLWRRSGEERLLAMVEKSLTAMRLGGIYDHIGFGFHRYSTDERWLLPHFEKMLYDQALLAMTYTEAWQATGRVLYRRTAAEIFTYVLRDLRRPEGAFGCAEDADSEGEEGRFYLWDHEELAGLLGDGELAAVTEVFMVRREGNFTDELGEASDRNLLHREGPGWPESDPPALESGRLKLLAAREMRVRPLFDDKVITDWNGLMIAALAKGAAAFGGSEYLEAAGAAASFVLDTLRGDDGLLRHRWRGGDADLPAHVDDYAFLVWGLIELYEASHEPRWLAAAVELTKTMLDLFWDGEEGGLFFSTASEGAVPGRQKIVDDGSYPSGNSVAAVNLVRLGRLTGDPSWEERAAALVEAFGREVAAHPTASTHLLGAVDMAHGGTEEIVISDGEGREELLEVLRREYLPNSSLHVLGTGRPEELVAVAPFLEGFEASGPRARAYVCRGESCSSPVEAAAQLKALLEGRA